MGNALTKQEQGQLAKWETIVENGVRTFLEVGTALAAIRDGKLYREKYKTFEKYCAERFGFERGQAYRLIEASAVCLQLETKIDVSEIPKKESQIREVAKAPPEKQAEVVQRANEKAWKEGKDQPTAKDFREAVQQIVIPEPEYEDIEEDDEVIESAPKSDLELALENAAVINGFCNEISQLKRRMNEVEAAPGLELFRERRASILRDLDNARAGLTTSAPKKICPRCKGKGCANCGRMGWVNSIMAKELGA